jgi:hypothetical protein
MLTIVEWHLRPSWGGYQWDTARYGDVPSLLSALHAMGLALGMNLHDGDGVQKSDNPSTWPSFAAAMGLPPSATGAPFAIGEKQYSDALAGAVMAPLMAGYGGAPPEGGLDMVRSAAHCSPGILRCKLRPTAASLALSYTHSPMPTRPLFPYPLHYFALPLATGSAGQTGSRASLG